MKYQEKHIDLFTVNKHNQEPYCLVTSNSCMKENGRLS